MFNFIAYASLQIVQIYFENRGSVLVYGLTTSSSCRKLKPVDHRMRDMFPEWTDNEIAVDPHFHQKILFSDEAHF